MARRRKGYGYIAGLSAAIRQSERMLQSGSRNMEEELTNRINNTCALDSTYFRDGRFWYGARRGYQLALDRHRQGLPMERWDLLRLQLRD